MRCVLLLFLFLWAGFPCIMETWDWGTQQSVQSYRCAGCDMGVTPPIDVVFVVRHDEFLEASPLIRSVIRTIPSSPQVRYAVLFLEFSVSADSHAIKASVMGGFSRNEIATLRTFEEQAAWVVSNVSITRLENLEQLGTSGVVSILFQLLTNRLGPRLQFRDDVHRHIILFTKGIPQSNTLHFHHPYVQFQLTKGDCQEFVRPQGIEAQTLHDLLNTNLSRSTFMFVTHESTPNFGRPNLFLSNLTKSDLVASLQVLFLLNCVSVEVLGTDELVHSRALLGSDFPNWGSPSLFCDPCLTGFVTRDCGMVPCAPGIGCTSATYKEVIKTVGDWKYGYGLTARYGHSSPFEESSLAAFSLPNNDTPSEACPAEFTSQRWTRKHLVKKTVPIKHWNPREPFLEEIVAKDEPVVIRHSIVSTWPALTSELWSLDQLHSRLNEQMRTLRGVKLARRESRFKVFDADRTQPMNFSFDLYSIVDMNVTKFFECLAEPPHELAMYHFMRLPEFLRPDVSPDHFLYFDSYDRANKEQYLWLSSRGPSMHTHFDQDRNVFIQLVGRKRFVLFPPAAHHQMYVYPRVHPLWHKAQPDFDQPNLLAFPEYAHAQAMEATLEPGDVLYVPPYYFHHVESLTASVSLSTWSTERAVKTAMDAAYGRGIFAQELQSPELKVAALRLFLHLLVRELYGVGQVDRVRRTLLRTRYLNLREQFPPPQGDFLRLCESSPVAPESLKEIEFDVSIVSRSFLKVKDEYREILLFDFIEQVACSVVGVDQLFAFLSACMSSDRPYTVVPHTPVEKAVVQEAPAEETDELRNTRCAVCHQVIRSHAEAQEHFERTGHINFETFRDEL